MPPKGYNGIKYLEEVPHMWQHEIKKMIPLLDEKGNLTEPGWARKLLPVYSRSAIKAPAARIKEWDYYLVANDHFAVALTIADNGYMGLDSISFLNFDTDEQTTKSPIRVMPMGRTGLPSTSREGVSAVSGKGYGMTFLHVDGKELGPARQLLFRMDDFVDGQPIQGSIMLFDEPEDSMVICTPFEKSGHFYYNQKINCMRASGTVTVGGQTYQFDPVDAWQCYKKGAFFANPCFAQIHPTCIPVHGTQQSKLTLMSESLRNDGRIWVPKKLEDAKALQAGTKRGVDIPEEDRDYYLERRYPAFGNLVPRDVASRAAKERCDAGYGVNNTGLAVFLDFKTAIERLGEDVIRARYGNLFQMYEKITDVNPYKEPMMIYPAIHYTRGGIWVDYNLQTTVPGLYAIGEANFSDHGGNRLGDSALMQGLAEGSFILPNTIGDYLAGKIKEPKT
ncbi:MAG: DUF2804 family protein, partial [Lachnospiraceae bacterium]|nr:DUF2804 family protein [Lachnospiraceae bacterium]